MPPYTPFFSIQGFLDYKLLLLSQLKKITYLLRAAVKNHIIK